MFQGEVSLCGAFGFVFWARQKIYRLQYWNPLFTDQIFCTENKMEKKKKGLQRGHEKNLIVLLKEIFPIIPP